MSDDLDPFYKQPEVIRYYAERDIPCRPLTAREERFYAPRFKLGWKPDLFLEPTPSDDPEKRKRA